MGFEDIKLEFDGPVACLTLNRPHKLNSLTWHMHQELKAAFDQIEARPIRAMLLTGEGRGFCAGQDLSDPLFKLDGDLGETLEVNYNPLVMRIKAQPFPVVCAVNGIAAGAGANLALACDIVLAARSASFLQAFARIGLIPDAGGTWTLTHRAGEARAKAMSMLAEPVPAETARSWGLIWEVVEDDELISEATSMVDRLAGQPTNAFRLIKQAIHAAPGQSFANQLALETRLQREAATSEDFQEGVSAFLAKRKPVFKGQ